MDLVKIENIMVREAKKSRAQELREKGYIYYHGKRVAELSMEIFKKVKTDITTAEMDLLYIAGMFHDIGKGRKHHAVAGAKMIPKLLGSELTQDEIKEVQRLIEEHNLREKPNVCLLDSKSLQDADVLDHFGAQGVWLSMYFTARAGGDQASFLSYYGSVEHKAYVKDKYNGLNFDVSKDIFNERYGYQKDFIKRICHM